MSRPDNHKVLRQMGRISSFQATITIINNIMIIFTCDGELQSGLLNLLSGGVHHELSLNQTHLHSRHYTHHRHLYDSIKNIVLSKTISNKEADPEYMLLYLAVNIQYRRVRTWLMARAAEAAQMASASGGYFLSYDSSHARTWEHKRV